MKTLLTAALAALALSLLPARAVRAANADYAAAVARTEAVASSLQSYEVRGTMHMATGVKGQDRAMEMTADILAAARYPDRMVSRQQGTIFNVDLGVGPDQSWFYLSQKNTCFVGKPYPLSRDLEADQDMALVPEKIFNFYSGLGQMLLPPGLDVAPETGQQVYKLGDREIPCQVFTTGAVPAEGKGPRKYWFDPESGLVLKAVMTMTGMRNGMAMEQTLTFTTSSFSLNQPVDESLFTFTPPEGAVVVDQLEKVVNPESMVGQKAPDISFTDLDGNPVNLTDYRGKVVFLDFWATWCGPCKMEMPHLQKLHEELSPSADVVFLCASSEDVGTIKSYIAKNGYTFKVVRVKAEDATGKYKASSIPAGFVIDRDGTIRAHMVGAQKEGQLRAALARAGIGR